MRRRIPVILTAASSIVFVTTAIFCVWARGSRYFSTHDRLRRLQVIQGQVWIDHLSTPAPQTDVVSRRWNLYIVSFAKVTSEDGHEWMTRIHVNAWPILVLSTTATVIFALRLGPPAKPDQSPHGNRK
jgi:hypothetical protein